MGWFRRPGFPRQREAGASPLAQRQWQQAGSGACTSARPGYCPPNGTACSCSRPRRARAQQLRPGVHRRSWLAAHLMLRQVLGGILGQDPGRVQLDRLPSQHCGKGHGRPVLAGEAGRQLHYSISHGAGLALVAIAGLPCGVDG